MKPNNSKEKKDTVVTFTRNAIQQMRPNNNYDTIMKPATKKEVKAAVRAINPDNGTLERG